MDYIKRKFIMENSISFILDGKLKHLSFSGRDRITPTTTVLNYLRSLPDHKGVKEGCAEGDCGACTVVLAENDGNGGLEYKAVNSCLIFLPKLHGKQLITVENISREDRRHSVKGAEQAVRHSLHPVQQALVNEHASQCGFCTPGITMSLFAMYKHKVSADREKIEEYLGGNLCRCTGYKPIVQAAQRALENPESDHFCEKQKQTVALLKTIPTKSLHLKTDNQSYFLPATLEDLLRLKNDHPEALLVNGSTDVALRVTKNFEHLPLIIDAANVPELKKLERGEGGLTIGGGVTINDFMAALEEDFPALFAICRRFGSHQIRNLATVGGSLGTASPIGDLAPVFMACEAKILVRALHGKREIDADEFISGYRQTLLAEDEIISGVQLPFIPDGVTVKAYKISRRRDLDIATVSAAFRLRLDEQNRIREIRIIFGGMAAWTQHAKKAETFLQGKIWTKETVHTAMPLVQEEFQPLSDARAEAEFRSQAAANLLLKFWLETQGDEQ